MAKLLHEVQELGRSASHEGALIAVVLTVIGMLLLFGLAWVAFPFIWANATLIFIFFVVIVALIVVSTTRK